MLKLQLDQNYLEDSLKHQLLDSTRVSNSVDQGSVWSFVFLTSFHVMLMVSTLEIYFEINWVNVQVMGLQRVGYGWVTNTFIFNT